MAATSDKLQIAIDAAKIGGKLALSSYNTDLGIQTKPDKTIVTNADKAVEKEIIRYISAQLPDPNFYGEETGGELHKTSCWMIDPIDGTRSFVRKIPTWDVLIAYWENGEVMIGVSYFPVFDTIIYAEKGKGAFIDGVQVHVSTIDTLANAYTGLGHVKSDHPENLMKLMQNSWNVRIMAAYSAYLVASGSMESYVAPSNKVYDFAPYSVIIQEAGGKLTAMDGSPWTPETAGGVLSNGLVHDEIVAILNKD